MRVLSLDEVKSLKTGQEVFLEEIGAVDSEESGERLIFRFEDAPEAVYLKGRRRHRLEKFTYKSLDRVYGHYWWIYEKNGGQKHEA